MRVSGAGASRSARRNTSFNTVTAAPCRAQQEVTLGTPGIAMADAATEKRAEQIFKTERRSERNDKIPAQAKVLIVNL